MILLQVTTSYMHGFIVLKGSYGDPGCTTVDETKTAHLMESKSASVRDSIKEIVTLYTNSAGPAFIYFCFLFCFTFFYNPKKLN